MSKGTRIESYLSIRGCQACTVLSGGLAGWLAENTAGASITLEGVEMDQLGLKNAHERKKTARMMVSMGTMGELQQRKRMDGESHACPSPGQLLRMLGSPAPTMVSAKASGMVGLSIHVVMAASGGKWIGGVADGGWVLIGRFEARHYQRRQGVGKSTVRSYCNHHLLPGVQGVLHRDLLSPCLLRMYLRDAVDTLSICC